MSLGSIAVKVAALLFIGLAATAFSPAAQALEFTDAAGRHVVLPDQIRRVMPAGPSADVLVFIIARDLLVGWSVPHPHARLPGKTARLPVTGRLTGPNPTATADTVRRLRPDVVIDAGAVTPERAAFADQMQQQTGVPYILIDSTIARTPATLRSLGATLGQVDRGQDLSRYARRSVETLHGRLLIRSADSRPRVYYGRGADGLETGLPGSPVGEAIDEAGAFNVATPLGRNERVRITREQLLGWDPDIIIAEEPAFYDSLVRDRSWQRLTAVRNKKFYLMPTGPFGWIDDPPGANRVIGLYWLSGLLYPDPTQEDVRALAIDLYDKLYGIKLTDAQLEGIVRRSGIPKNEMAFGAPITALTGAPKGPLPGMQVTPPTVVPGVAPPGRRGGGAAPPASTYSPLPNMPGDTPMPAPTR